MILLPFVLIISIIVQVFIPGFPKETILLFAGASFGIIIGSLINWIGMVLGAQVAYETTRYSILAGGRFSDTILKYQESNFINKLELRGNRGLFIIRLIPYAPNDVLSMVSGALLLPRFGFIIVSCVTAIPYAVLFAYLGYLGSNTLDLSTLFLINIIIAITSILASILYTRVVKKRRISSN